MWIYGWATCTKAEDTDRRPYPGAAALPSRRYLAAGGDRPAAAGQQRRTLVCGAGRGGLFCDRGLGIVGRAARVVLRGPADVRCPGVLCLSDGDCFPTEYAAAAVGTDCHRRLSDSAERAGRLHEARAPDYRTGEHRSAEDRG